jgi:hypothetical protein
MHRTLSIAALAGLIGCAGTTAEKPAAAHAPQASAPEVAVSPTAAPPGAEEEGALSGAESTAEPASEPGGAAARVEAGSIQRSTLMAVLSSGVGRFLQKVRAEPHLQSGRFVGWRLVTLFDGDRAGALQRGDTVMRVNGQGIERPEQFKEVWDKLAAQPELVLLVQREGRQSELHYRIVE